MNNETPEYKGPGEITVAVGQSAIDSWAGSAAGTAVGAAAGALLHKEAATVAIKNANQAKEAVMAAKGVKGAIPPSREIIETAERVLSENKGLKGFWNGMGRGGKALAGALAGMAIIGTITQLTGYFRGSKKAKAAREQFDGLVAENQALKGQLQTAETRIDEQKSFVNALQNERNVMPSNQRG